MNDFSTVDKETVWKVSGEFYWQSLNIVLQY